MRFNLILRTPILVVLDLTTATAVETQQPLSCARNQASRQARPWRNSSSSGVPTKAAVATQYAEDIARTSVGLYMLSCVLYGKSRRPLGLPFNAVRCIFFAQRTLYCVHNVVIRHGKIYPASP